VAVDPEVVDCSKPDEVVVDCGKLEKVVRGEAEEPTKVSVVETEDVLDGVRAVTSESCQRIIMPSPTARYSLRAEAVTVVSVYIAREKRYEGIHTSIHIAPAPLSSVQIWRNVGENLTALNSRTAKMTVSIIGETAAIVNLSFSLIGIPREIYLGQQRTAEVSGDRDTK